MDEKTNKKIFVCNGASNHSDVEREIHDFYATPKIATIRLVEYLKENYPNVMAESIWEPACGKGHISEIFRKEGVDIVSTDLIDRGYGQCGDEYDFLKSNITKTDKHIVTNPPYKYAKEFVDKSLDILEDGKLCCMLLKLTFLEGNKRYELFKKYPPKHLLVFSNRINCALGGDFEKTSEMGGAVAYGWYIWEKGYDGKTMIDWIKA